MASIVVTGDTSGAITIAAPAVAGTNTLTLPASTGTLVVTGGAQTIEFADGSAAAPSITNSGDTNTGMFFPAADTIAFTEGGTESMRIDASGNLLVGNTTDPLGGNRLLVQSAATANNNRTFSVYNSAATSTTAFANRLVQISSSGSGADATIHFSDQVANNAYFGMGSGALYFATGGTTERMRIDSSGRLLVGATSFGGAGGFSFEPSATAPRTQYKGSSTSNSDTTLELFSTGAGAFRFYVGYGGTIFATSTTITGISDQRLKENIVDLDDGLDAVMSLKPRKFDWKAGKGKDIKGDRGFIAQEFETVFPDMIEEWKDPAPEGEEPYKGVNANLIPTLVKAIQELNAKVEAQAVRIAELEGAK